MKDDIEAHAHQHDVRQSARSYLRSLREARARRRGTAHHAIPSHVAAASVASAPVATAFAARHSKDAAAEDVDVAAILPQGAGLSGPAEAGPRERAAPDAGTVAASGNGLLAAPGYGEADGRATQTGTQTGAQTGSEWGSETGSEAGAETQSCAGVPVPVVLPSDADTRPQPEEDAASVATLRDLAPDAPEPPEPTDVDPPRSATAEAEATEAGTATGSTSDSAGHADPAGDTAGVQTRGQGVTPDEPALLAESELMTLPGMGPGLVWMLNRSGVMTLHDMAEADIDRLRAALGLVGDLLDLGYWRARARAEVGAK